MLESGGWNPVTLMPPEAKKESLKKVLRAIVVRAIQSVSKMLFVFEDVHWMDVDSWDLLLEVASTPSLLVLLTQRPFGEFPDEYSRRCDIIPGLLHSPLSPSSSSSASSSSSFSSSASHGDAQFHASCGDAHFFSNLLSPDEKTEPPPHLYQILNHHPIHFRRLCLSPLSSEDVTALAQELLGESVSSLSPSLARLVLREARGLPMHCEHLILFLLHEKMLEGPNALGEVRLSPIFDDDPSVNAGDMIPHALEQLICHRVLQMNASTREVLLAASSFRTPFTTRMLLAVCCGTTTTTTTTTATKRTHQDQHQHQQHNTNNNHQLHEQEVVHCLQELVARHWLQLSPLSQWKATTTTSSNNLSEIYPGGIQEVNRQHQQQLLLSFDDDDDTFTFASCLTQTLCHQLMPSPARRSEYHRRIARWVEHYCVHDVQREIVPKVSVSGGGGGGGLILTLNPKP